MVQAPAKSLTLDAFLALPDTQPASEFVDGRISQKPMPQGQHSRLQLDLSKLIDSAVRDPKIACAFPELRCSFGGHSIVPDIAVVTWDRIPVLENGNVANVFSLAPDWIIEILSPEQSPTKVTKKILRSLQHGSKMGWLIVPEDESVFVYRSHREVEVYDSESGETSLPVPDFMSEFSLSIEELFGLLKL
ncbi:MAG: Uma2 family endonuclease [Cyanobacteria bacterium J06560_2]